MTRLTRSGRPPSGFICDEVSALDHGPQTVIAAVLHGQRTAREREPNARRDGLTLLGELELEVREQVAA